MQNRSQIIENGALWSLRSKESISNMILFIFKFKHSTLVLFKYRCRHLIIPTRTNDYKRRMYVLNLGVTQIYLKPIS